MATLDLSGGIMWRGSNYTSIPTDATDYPVLYLSFGTGADSLKVANGAFPGGQNVQLQFVNGGFSVVGGILQVSPAYMRVLYFDGTTTVNLSEGQPGAVNTTNGWATPAPFTDPLLGTDVSEPGAATRIPRSGWDWHSLMVLMRTSTVLAAADGLIEIIIDGTPYLTFNGEVKPTTALFAFFGSRPQGDADAAWLRNASTEPTLGTDGLPLDATVREEEFEGADPLDPRVQAYSANWRYWARSAFDTITLYFQPSGGIDDTGVIGVDSGLPSVYAFGGPTYSSHLSAGFETWIDLPGDTETGTIVVVKVNTVEGDDTDFPFIATNLTPGTFELAGDEMQTFADLTPGNDYGIQETTPAGWQTTYEVSNASPLNHLDVGAGETVTVLVTNSQATAQVYPVRRQRTFTIPNDENKWIFLDELQLEFQRGQGLVTGQGSDPQFMFQLSRDGGQTWGPERWVSAGKLGEYTTRAIIYKLGRARNPVGRVTVSDPIFWALQDAYLQAKPGTS